MSAAATRLEQLTVKVPMVPASCLLPNAQRRTNYHVWCAEAKALRDAAMWSGRSALNYEWSHVALYTVPVRISAKIAWPKGRKTCDFQAAVHALKAAVDGLEDAGVLANDKQVVGMDIEQIRAEKDDLAGWIELTITGD